MLIEPIDPEYRQVAPFVDVNGKIYSQYGIGMLAIVLPIVAISKMSFVAFGINEDLLTHFLLSFYNLPFALLALWHFKNILKELGGSEKYSRMLMICLGVGTIFWKYTATDFSEITQIALLLGALREYLRDHNRRWLRVSVYLALLVLLKIVFVIILPLWVALAIYDGVVEKKLLRNLAHLSCFLIPCSIFLMIFNHIRFGSIMETGYASQVPTFSIDYFRRDFFDYIYSLQRGIFPFSPLLIVGVFLWPVFLRRHTKFAIMVCSTTILWFVLMASYKGLQGGYCWGNRNLLPIVPLLAIPWVYLDWNVRPLRAIFTALLVISLPIQIIGVCLKTHEYSVLAGRIAEKTGNFDLPDQLPGSALLFKEKTTNTSGIYHSNFILADSNHTIDLTSFESFQGFNFWLVHACKFYSKNNFVKSIGNSIILIFIALLTYLFHKRTQFN